MKRIATLVLVSCLASTSAADTARAFTSVKHACRSKSPALLSPGGARTYSLAGMGHTNILDSGTTLGAAEINARGRRLRCGILGELQTTNADGTLAFRHTLSCEDHSLFVLRTHTVLQEQSACTTRSGFVGTFDETSVIEGVDGPFAGWSGEDTITGTINCGFVDFVFTGTLTRP